MIYHYTTRLIGMRIRRAGFIKALPMLLYLDLMATRERQLSPVVWFTVSEELDGPIRVKGMVDGITVEQPGAFWRFCFPDEIAPDNLPTWADRHGHHQDLFYYMIMTADMAGSEYPDWRLSETDVSLTHCLAIEHLVKGEWLPVSEES